MPPDKPSKHPVKGQHLAALATQLQKCAKCGECRSVCPVFAELQRERYVARGKLALVEALAAGELPPSDPLREALNQCLLCLSCVARCGSGVPVDRIIKAARAEVVIERGLPLPKRLVFGLLASGRGMLNLALQSGSLLQPILFRRIPESSGLRRRFPLPLIDKERYIPHLARHPFRTGVPEILPAADSKDTVVFFTGCFTNYIHTQTAEAVVEVLNRLGVTVIIPKDQTCCGAPVEASGDVETALRLARRNLDVLSTGQSGNKKVVVPCASGGYMLKHVYAHLLAGDPIYRRKAEALAARTLDISEYLVRHIGIGTIARHVKAPLQEGVTYHDPCHLNRGQDIRDEPRVLLRLACPEFMEMAEPGRCCGSGGIYGITHRDTSNRILARKIANVLETPARIVATGCPGCIIQVTDGLHQRGAPLTARHTIELLARSMG